MSRRLKLTLFSLGVLAIVAAGVYAYAVQLVHEMQPFYVQALEKPRHELEAAGRRMESRVTALCSDAKQPGCWQTVFTADEVNGWLATILKDKYTDLLPPEVDDPRLAFGKGTCQLGYRYHGRFFDTVVTVDGDGWMETEDLAAVRFRHVRAGSLPLPISNVVDEVSAGAAKLQIPIRWTQQDGDPVMLVPVANALSTDKEVRQLQKLELHDGELRLSGKTEPRPQAEAKVATTEPPAAAKP